jgi:hypothetical protein
MACNTCCNSYYPSLEERVLQFIENSEIETTPLAIASNLHSNRSSVRVILRRLLEKGKIVQPYQGSYSNKIIHGMRFAPLRIHNILLTVEHVDVSSHWKWSDTIGDCCLSVVFGSERGKVSCRVCCDKGLDRNACLMTVKRCVEVIENRLGHAVENVVVKTFEANKDYGGVRLDGVTCLTVKGLYDVIERVYQKEENVVRQEFKVTTPIELRNFEGLLQGGLGQYNMTQVNFEMVQEIRRLTEGQKTLNTHVGELTKILQALYERQLRQDEGGESAFGKR